MTLIVVGMSFHRQSHDGLESGVKGNGGREGSAFRPAISADLHQSIHLEEGALSATLCATYMTSPGGRCRLFRVGVVANSYSRRTTVVAILSCQPCFRTSKAAETRPK
jgi:hypothetical protein